MEEPNLTKLINVAPPLDFVLPGVLRGAVSSLAAPTCAGKSMLALQMSALVASGSDTLGLGSVSTGRVLYLALQDPQAALHHRLWALGRLMTPLQRERMVRNLDLHCLVGQQVDLLAANGSWASYLATHAAGCRLLVIDPLRRAHLANEDDGAKMAALIGLLESLASQENVAILILDCATHALALDDHEAAQRGEESLLVNRVGCQHYMAPMTERDAEILGVQDSPHQWVRHGWATNWDGPIAERWYRRYDHGLLGLRDIGLPLAA